MGVHRVSGRRVVLRVAASTVVFSAVAAAAPTLAAEPASAGGFWRWPRPAILNAVPLADGAHADANTYLGAEPVAVPIELQARDRDGDAVTFSLDAPEHGSLSSPGPVSCSDPNPNPSIIAFLLARWRGASNTCTTTVWYTPCQDCGGPDSFGFTARDRFGGVSTRATAIVDVLLQDAPFARGDIPPVGETAGPQLLSAVDSALPDLEYTVEPIDCTGNGSIPRVEFSHTLYPSFVSHLDIEDFRCVDPVPAAVVPQETGGASLVLDVPLSEDPAFSADYSMYRITAAGYPGFAETVHVVHSRGNCDPSPLNIELAALRPGETEWVRLLDVPECVHLYTAHLSASERDDGEIFMGYYDHGRGVPQGHLVPEGPLRDSVRIGLPNEIGDYTDIQTEVQVLRESGQVVVEGTGLLTFDIISDWQQFEGGSVVLQDIGEVVLGDSMLDTLESGSPLLDPELTIDLSDFNGVSIPTRGPTITVVPEGARGSGMVHIGDGETVLFKVSDAVLLPTDDVRTRQVALVIEGLPRETFDHDFETIQTIGGAEVFLRTVTIGEGKSSHIVVFYTLRDVR